MRDLFANRARLNRSRARNVGGHRVLRSSEMGQRRTHVTGLKLESRRCGIAYRSAGGLHHRPGRESRRLVFSSLPGAPRTPLWAAGGFVR